MARKRATVARHSLTGRNPIAVTTEGPEYDARRFLRELSAATIPITTCAASDRSRDDPE